MEPSRGSSSNSRGIHTYQEAQAEYEKFGSLKAFGTKVFAILAGLVSGGFAYESAFTWMVNLLSDTNAKTKDTADSVHETAKLVFKGPEKIVKEMEPYYFKDLSLEDSKKTLAPFLDKEDDIGTYLVRTSRSSTPDRLIYTLDVVKMHGISSKRFTITPEGTIEQGWETFETFEEMLEFNDCRLDQGMTTDQIT